MVRARLGISIIPVEIASAYAGVFGLKVIPLRDDWASRRFAICLRDRGSLPKAAAMLVDFLAAAASGE